MKINLALAQVTTVLGNVEKNLEKHLAVIRDAGLRGADLVVFPELSLTGYVLQDLVPTVACRPRKDDPVFQPLFAASQKIDIVVGFAEEDVRNRFYIASAYLSRGELLHTAATSHLKCAQS